MNVNVSHDVILKVTDLQAEFTIGDGNDESQVQVLSGVSFEVKRGQTLGIVGESGCGKSVTAMSIMGLLPRPHGQVTGGSVLFSGSGQDEELTTLDPENLYKMRGNRISMIFQEPMTALNPVHTVGQQIGEVFKLHRPELGRKQRRDAMISILEKVGISAPESRLHVYPHQLSGGMRQRVMIAMALACEPDILIADEPTTALDVTIQAQILELMRELQQETGMAIIFITHDLGVVAEMCDQVVVMYAGQVVEYTNVYRLFEKPKHPYTKGLLQSMPRLDHTSKQHLQTIDGTVPSLQNMPEGCRFSNRCRYVRPPCEQRVPQPEQVFSCKEVHQVACLRADELTFGSS